ncbi:phosphate ABC transporter substrate-binding protein [Paenibacillus pasadenensis]|uniref:phosphate ABC transporter substrate-binding protein n=1 Tax=Paenibacillus pasadenensis TaxID=217090 RepID=UPI0020412F46|nr:phosphate ABC transporter substrate-binding protein [Paenibacillus pasadenensis]MCM3746946.1 phosphate ABC transporter substrate-binding protein [Paenibacillus pasadenensis]
MKKTMLVLMTMVLALTLAACGSKEGNNASGSEADSGSLSGSILAAGSTAMQPLVEQVSKKFMADSKYKDITVQVQGGGSGTGLTQVSEGQADIGNSDIFANEKFKDGDAAKADELVDHQVAVVAMATVVNKDIAIDNLTKQQLVDIFTGKVTNWKDVGGADEKIVIVNRPSSSGTRKTFEKYALGTKSEDLPGNIQEDSSGTVKKLVGETPGAIGYLALSYLDDSVKTLKLDGVEATPDNVKTGTYPVWAYQHMYTKGEPNEAVKAFLDFMVSDDVQKTDVTELGYISIKEMTVERNDAGEIVKK